MFKFKCKGAGWSKRKVGTERSIQTPYHFLKTKKTASAMHAKPAK